MLTDSMGRTVSFKNAIVVMTSNAGSGEDQKGGLGFLPQGEKARFTLALRQLFSPEFLGRIDCVACFEKLGPAGAYADREAAAGGALKAGKIARANARDRPRRGGGNRPAGDGKTGRSAQYPAFAPDAGADAALRRAALRDASESASDSGARGENCRIGDGW